jgi:membrane protein
MKKTRASALNLIDYLRTGIWQFPLAAVKQPKAFVIRVLRILLLTIRDFAVDNCAIRASSLTFYTLLSIVPVAAMAFGIAKGFGFEKLLEKQVLDSFAGQEEVILKIIDFAHSLLENTQGGLIAGIGIVLLLWSVLKVLNHIENALNHIWSVAPRSYGRKVSDYLTIMLIGPLLVIISSSVNVYITSQVTAMTDKVALLGMVSPLIFSALKILPYGLIWTVFTLIYIVMPNTRINILSGVIAGVVAGTFFQLFQGIYISAQINVAKYNAIYGSFAALPLFLIWLQVSWLIVLFGAEISYAHQNVAMYEFEPDYRRASSALKKLLALQIAHLLVKKFKNGENPATTRQISQRLTLPLRLVKQILADLVGSGILSATTGNKIKETAYQPARDINTLSIGFIINALDDRGGNDLNVGRTRELEVLSEALQSFRNEVGKSPANRLLKDI